MTQIVSIVLLYLIVTGAIASVMDPWILGSGLCLRDKLEAMLGCWIKLHLAGLVLGIGIGVLLLLLKGAIKGSFI